MGYEGDPEEGKELGPRARPSRRAKIRVRSQTLSPTLTGTASLSRRPKPPQRFAEGSQFCRCLFAPDIIKGSLLMPPGMPRCNGAPGGGIPLQQARMRGQAMVILYRLFRGSRCSAPAFIFPFSFVRSLQCTSLSALSSYRSEPRLRYRLSNERTLFKYQNARNPPFDPC